MKSNNSSIVFLIASILLLSCNFVRSLVPIGGTPSDGSSNAAPAECEEFALTPEECANAGTHEYSTTTQILFDRSGETCIIDDSDITASIAFLSRDTLLYTDAYLTDVEFTRKDHNYYEGGYIQPDGEFEWKDAITFAIDGFTMQGDSYAIEENQHLCTFLWEQKIITGKEE